MKICATIKPTEKDKERIRSLCASGIDIVRIPLWQTQDSNIPSIIRLVNKFGLGESPIEILLDLPGNKIRFGFFVKEPQCFRKGETYTLSEGEISRDSSNFAVNYKGFAEFCKVGDLLIAGDNEAFFKVSRTYDKKVEIIPMRNATIYSRKGISIQGNQDYLKFTNYDDLRHAIDLSKTFNINWFALSFTSSKEQVREIKENYLLDRNLPKLMAKIESRDGVRNLAEIIDSCDGCMVARGDLASYLDYSKMGIIQKMILRECQLRGKFSLVSTGILMSLMEKALPRPSEIVDITTACLDGADAIQFCEETAHGEDPAYVVAIARRIINSVEEYKSQFYRKAE